MSWRMLLVGNNCTFSMDSTVFSASSNNILFWNTLWTSESMCTCGSVYKYFIFFVSVHVLFESRFIRTRKTNVVGVHYVHVFLYFFCALLGIRNNRSCFVYISSTITKWTVRFSTTTFCVWNTCVYCVHVYVCMCIFSFLCMYKCVVSVDYRWNSLCASNNCLCTVCLGVCFRVPTWRKCTTFFVVCSCVCMRSVRLCMLHMRMLLWRIFLAQLERATAF